MTSTSQRITDLLAAHPVWDGHNDLPWEARKQVGYDLDRLDLTDELSTTHTDLVRMRRGGMGDRGGLAGVVTPVLGVDGCKSG